MHVCWCMCILVYVYMRVYTYVHACILWSVYVYEGMLRELMCLVACYSVSDSFGEIQTFTGDPDSIRIVLVVDPI